MDPSAPVPLLAGLALDAVEWLPSGSDAGLVRVRGRWTDLNRREPDLPALGVRRGAEQRRFESLPDARFGRDPAVWRATYLVPAALMEPFPDALWLGWGSGARVALPAPSRGLEPPPAPIAEPVPEPGGEVIDRAVLAEHRARRAEAAERASAQRAAEALKAVEVLELRSAELERRLEALQSPPAEVAPLPVAEPEPPAAPAVAEAPAAPAVAEPAVAEPPAAPAVSPQAHARALASVKELRGQLGEQQRRARRAELLHAAGEVALASLGDERARADAIAKRLEAAEQALERAASEAAAAREHARLAEADAAAAREQAAEQVRLAGERAAADAAAVRARADEALAEARTERDSERAAAAEALAARDSEREAHAEVRGRLQVRDRELTAIAAELAGVRAELEDVRADAADRAAGLDRRLAALDAALAGEREAHASTAAELEAVRAALSEAQAGNRAEAIARGALDEELDRERLARSALADALGDARQEAAEVEALRAELAAARERTGLAEQRAGDAERSLAAELRSIHEQELALRAELTGLRDRHAVDEATLHAQRDERGIAEAELTRVQGELEAALARVAELEHELSSGGLQTRIAELERAADTDLERRAREQAAAAAAVAPPADREAIAGQFDAAAAALRARVTPPPDPEPEAALDDGPPGRTRAVSASADPQSAPVAADPEPAEPEPVAAEPVPAEPVSAEEEHVPAEPVAADPEPVADAPPPVAAPRPRTHIVTESRHPPRADVVGRSRRDYPWLRGALVKLAHDDPRAATRLLLGLVPAQHALLDAPVEYDLTIRDAGTYAVSVGAEGASARTVASPRPRAEAAFHVTADVVTLAELLAGVPRRMGRWFGPVRVKGRKRGAEVLRDTLAGAQLDLGAAARAGADLDPDLVFRSFAYAIQPAWTKGHRFVVAQEIADPSPQRWHLVVRDGAPIEVEKRLDGEPDAVVSMSRATFGCLIRGDAAPHGERPAVRGDRAAVGPPARLDRARPARRRLTRRGLSRSVRENRPRDPGAVRPGI